ncbi:MAG: efflux RND transporter periplasmic adaptor subunit, partial [Opitutales bacterium]|nr:efflux RND transporter periplasmic adaptor subunit [Opitutales bacterium]
PVKLVFDDGSVYEHAGNLKFSEVSVDKSTGMYTLRAEFPNPDNLLLPGMFARAVLEEGVNKQAVLVPQKAVSLGTAGKATVFTVNENGMVVPRPITVGKMEGTAWTVTSGLKPGDRIAADGMISIGMALAQNPAGVKIVAPSETPKPEEAAPAESAEAGK